MSTIVTRNLRFANRTWSNNRFINLKLRISIQKNMKTKVTTDPVLHLVSSVKDTWGKNLLLIKKQQQQPYYQSNILDSKSWKIFRKCTSIIQY
jgi:hypothetical protein